MVGSRTFYTIRNRQRGLLILPIVALQLIIIQQCCSTQSFQYLTPRYEQYNESLNTNERRIFDRRQNSTVQSLETKSRFPEQPIHHQKLPEFLTTKQQQSSSLEEHFNKVFGSQEQSNWISYFTQSRKRRRKLKRLLQINLEDEDATYAVLIKRRVLSFLFGIEPKSSQPPRYLQDAEEEQQSRRVEDGDGNDDKQYSNDDEASAQQWGDNAKCRSFLLAFLEGTTDSRDTCEGIMNAYVAASCSGSSSSASKSSNKYKYSNQANEYLDYDDYFQEFTEHQCCQILHQHQSDYCEEDTLLTNFHLLLAVSVLLLCECAKAIVVHYQVHFLPEAGVCILVGTVIGFILRVVSDIKHMDSIEKLSFDNELFLSLLLPPIIFEAALSVSKFEFKRRRGAIFMFSVFGTVISTFTTGLMVHYVSKWSMAETFPMLDSLVFGALISSIDPVAILSVLTNLNLDQRDTIFILVFGESLLNDGIAITVFQTLVNRFDGKTTENSTSLDEILDALATFMISMFGSIVIGLACGCGAWAYFNRLGNLLPPVMEVGSFFLWALVPYYISDGVGWSGIVSIVAVGFFMDIYIAGPKHSVSDIDYNRSMVSPSSNNVTMSAAQIIRHRRTVSALATAATVDDNNATNGGGYLEMRDEPKNKHHGGPNIQHNQHPQHINPQNPNLPVIQSVDSMQTSRSIGPLPSTERINMSATADRHVRFVAHLTSHLAENAIFAYIGLFLFSNNYDWNATLIAIAVSSCILSRVLMVIVVAWLIYHIYKCRGISSFGGNNSSRTAAAIQNPRTQAVLVLAGLRGAVSLALVENVPIYNSVTGQGCEFKQLMKGMTSACIVFTTFVFGGGAYYILPHLGVVSTQQSNGHQREYPAATPKSDGVGSDPYSPPTSPIVLDPCSTNGKLRLCQEVDDEVISTNMNSDSENSTSSNTINLSRVRAGSSAPNDYHMIDKTHPII